MTQLEPGQLSVFRVHAAIFGAALLLTALIGEAILRTAVALPVGAIVAPVVLLLIYPVLFAPARQYRAWGYAADADELRVHSGVVTQVQTLVPYARVQHIDVAQGPVERSFAVSRLVLHTAGTANSVVVLPGLKREQAERLRDEIRARIRQAPA